MINLVNLDVNIDYVLTLDKVPQRKSSDYFKLNFQFYYPGLIVKYRHLIMLNKMMMQKPSENGVENR